jgi:tRNA threonylcarbamoyl adenosine modification protein YjeE
MLSNDFHNLSASYKLTSLEDTKIVAEKIAQNLNHGSTILLRGSLGSGKTTFAGYLISGLTGIEENISSPTFPILQTYTSDRGEIYHFDLYRLEDPEELIELGFEEALEETTIIEWPEIAEELIPKDHLLLEFNWKDSESIILEIKDYRKLRDNQSF